MKILAFASRKGGSGKTTLAAHLAIQADLTGAGPVGLIDADPQGTLSDWFEERGTGNLLFGAATTRQLSHQIKAMANHGVRYLMIDTPPSVGTAIGTVIRHADLVVIPARPSPHDLRAAGATVAIAEGLGKPLVFVVNGAHHRARITADATRALARHGKVAPVVLHHRVGFAGAMIDGRTAMEVPGSPRSADEVAALWSYVKRRVAQCKPKDPAADKSRVGKAIGTSAKRAA